MTDGYRCRQAGCRIGETPIVFADRRAGSSKVNTREAGGTRVSTFRVGCTPRYLRNGMWVDGQTSWYTVHAWRTPSG